jgi:hypothetical protein
MLPLIPYEDICTTNISDDSGFIEVSTPSTPATPYSVENFVDYYLSKFSKEQVTMFSLLEWKGSQIYQYLLSILRCKLTSQTTCLDSVFGVLDEDL